jgi:hypothetical protein
MGLKPMVIVVIAMMFLIIPGLLYNNFSASGLTPNQVLGTAGVCGTFGPGVPIDVTCQGTVNAGCQAASSQCTLNGVSISFLNQASPFTQIIQGNPFQLFNLLTSNGNQNRGPFDANGGGAYYTADCYVVGIVAGAGRNITTNTFASHINACTQTNADGSNMTKYVSGSTAFQTFTWGDWNFNQLGTSQVSVPFFHIWNNATYALTCYNQGYWFLTNQASIGYSIEGCDYYKGAGYSPPASPSVNPVYSFLIAVPCNLGVGACKAQTFPTGNTHMEIFVQPEQWDTQFCTNAFTVATQNQATWYGSQQCVNLQTWLTSPHGGATFNLGFFTPLLTILLGLVLFLIGLGINVQGGGSVFGNGTQFGVGTNVQGTRLAQALGIGLIVWSPMYSEFSSWFTSGVLPYGLDGTTGVIGVALTGMFFFGLYWLILNAGAGD